MQDRQKKGMKQAWCWVQQGMAGTAASWGACVCCKPYPALSNYCSGGKGAQSLKKKPEFQLSNIPKVFNVDNKFTENIFKNIMWAEQTPGPPLSHQDSIRSSESSQPCSASSPGLFSSVNNMEPFTRLATVHGWGLCWFTLLFSLPENQGWLCSAL